MTRNPPTLLSLFRAAPALLTLLAVACAPLRAADFAEWKNRQTIDVSRAGIAVVVLPPETLDAARPDRGDLRLLDSAGREVAFAIHQAARPAVQTVAVKSFRATLTETATQLVIEGGALPLGEITLVTPAREFLKRARIETSEDGTRWTIAEDGVPFFRQSGVERLSLQPNAWFARITLDDARSRPVPFTGAMFTPFAGAIAPGKALPMRIARREEFAGETVLTLDLSAAHVPLDTLTFETPERLFTRRVTVGVRELRDESATERAAATGTIYRVAIDDNKPIARLAVPLDFSAPSREVILHIANDDSPPLAITEAGLTRFDVTLLFEAAVPGAYTLLSGHPQVAAPRYDVARLRARELPMAGLLTPGPLAPNPAYRAPEALAGVALTGAALDVAPWRFRKAVRVAAAGVQQLELDLDVLARAQRGLGDLRLVRDGAQVPFLLERPNLSRTLALTARPADDPRRPRTSRWEIALPRAGLPLTRLTLASPAALFQRQLRLLEIVADARGEKHARTLATAEWSHTPEDKRPLTLALSAPPTAAMLVLETDNGDNPPIALGPVTAAHPVARLLFKADAAPVALYYGHAGAATPRYDLALVAGQILAATKEAATLGPEEALRAEAWPTSVLRGPNSILFWGALALVVAVLLGVVAKLLPKPPAA